MLLAFCISDLRNVNLKTEKSHCVGSKYLEILKAPTYPLRTAAWRNRRESESGSLLLKSYSYSNFCQNDLGIWTCPADPIYRKRLNPAERIYDISYPINLRLFE